MSTSIQQQTKKCSKCKMTKPFAEFNKQKRGKFGLHSQCRQCQSEYKKAWSEKNKDRVSESWAVWYSENSEMVRAKEKERRDSDPEFYRSKCREWYKNNKEIANTLSNEWSRNNPDKTRIHNAKRKAKKAQVANDNHTDQQVWELYGTDCYLCGVQVVRDGKRLPNYHEEHVIPISRGGDNTLDNVRPSCQPCNNSKWANFLLQFLARRQPSDFVVTEADEAEYMEECRRLDAGMICVGYSMSL